jgi:disulfide bond formation protein DsbB
MDDGVQQQTLCVYQDMALLAFNLLAGIIARRIDREPPFSALLTLWLSMIAAVGLASRSASSRHFT